MKKNIPDKGMEIISISIISLVAKTINYSISFHVFDEAFTSFRAFFLVTTFLS
jgi:hypothetical protein